MTYGTTCWKKDEEMVILEEQIKLNKKLLLSSHIMFIGLHLVSCGKEYI